MATTRTSSDVVWMAEDAVVGDELRRGAWMMEDATPLTSSDVTWMVEDAAAGDELQRGM
uniref:Uncharacterized protein n=1 Tax=Oryza punctata TaxID=4537 RepID=A0A0E0KNY7_ORYPU